MGKTVRWWQKIGYEYNPYHMKHELKEIRIQIHRAIRHLNKVRIKKGVDIEAESKTCGWVSY